VEGKDSGLVLCCVVLCTVRRKSQKAAVRMKGARSRFEQRSSQIQVNNVTALLLLENLIITQVVGISLAIVTLRDLLPSGSHIYLHYCSLVRVPI